jgi:uncharacterized phage-associated protein
MCAVYGMFFGRGRYIFYRVNTQAVSRPPGGDFMYTAKQIALWFIDYDKAQKGYEESEGLSNLKIQKLLYYAQGVFLAIKGSPLFGDELRAWKYGPVVESVYNDFKHFDSQPVKIPDDDNFEMSVIAEEDVALLASVYETFGQYTAWKLCEMTHAEAPWKETPNKGVIPLEKIKEYFLAHHVEED